MNLLTASVEAVEASTQGSAFAAGQESDQGSVTASLLADLVVLSNDILVPAEVPRSRPPKST